jgi:PiT family inorganic phosphate transporter
MHGWQDGQKLIGIALTVLYTGGGHIPFYIPVSVGIILALGTLLGGKRIIKTLGVDLVKLSSTSALCSDLGAYACLAVFSLFGIPLSTSNVKSFAIIGSGLGADERINKKATIKVILTSTATFPICFLLGYVLMAILNAL